MFEEFMATVRARRSVRSYLPQPVDAALLRQIVEAGLLAPYAGEPSAAIRVITDEPLLRRISAAAKRSAVQSGIPHLVQLGQSADFDPLYNAPVLVLLSDTENGLCPDVNCAAAAENILLSAQAAGLGGCWLYFALMAFQGADAPDLRRAVNFPAGHKLCASLVLGYPGDDAPPSPRPMDRIQYIG